MTCECGYVGLPWRSSQPFAHANAPHRILDLNLEKEREERTSIAQAELSTAPRWGTTRWAKCAAAMELCMNNLTAGRATSRREPVAVCGCDDQVIFARLLWGGQRRAARFRWRPPARNQRFLSGTLGLIVGMLSSPDPESK